MATRQWSGAERVGADQSRRLALWAAGIGVAAATMFMLAPGIDLAVARLFVRADGGFGVGPGEAVPLIRQAFKTAFVVICTVAVAGLALAVLRRSARPQAHTARWLYLVLCLSVGPGLVANVLLKDHWGRARPAQIVEFGGTKAFSAPLVPADQCQRNCSFVSGEAAAIFASFYAMALAMPQWSMAMLVAGTVAGLGAGLMRMAQGGHFLSDVVFAGVLMALTAAALHRLMFGRGASGQPTLHPQASARQGS